MTTLHTTPTLEADGWKKKGLPMSPDSFAMPSRVQRESLAAGDAAKLLFYIETRADGHIVDRGTERMWVIVKSKTVTGYIGILDNDPGGAADGLNLRERDFVAFGPEHVCDIGKSPHQYIVEKYGKSFFETLTVQTECCASK